MPLQPNNYVWDLFSEYFGVDWFYGGEILLSYGDWTITLDAKIPIKNAWLSMAVPEDATPVCCGDVSIAGAKVNSDNTITIDAKVRSDWVTLHYWLQQWG